MDASVMPLKHGGLCLVQTTDFFYPIVDDPYMQGSNLKSSSTSCTNILQVLTQFIAHLTGRIACANVLSDLYAMGVTGCDNMLMICGVSNRLSDRERDVVMPLMMQGFRVTLQFLYNSQNNF